MYDCFNYGGRWENKDLNFDNIFNSILSLAVIFLRGGYVQLMNNSVDSVDIGFIPKKLNNLGYQYVFIAYVIICSTFLTNLFIEKVIST